MQTISLAQSNLLLMLCTLCYSENNEELEVLRCHMYRLLNRH